MQEPERSSRDNDIEIRRETLESLRGKSDETCTDLLLSAMEDTSWRIRNTAVDILIE
jgi:HEAT repeat protein